MLLRMDTTTEKAVQDERESIRRPTDPNFAAIWELWEQYTGPCKDNSATKEVATAVGKWERRCRHMCEDQREAELPEVCTMAALRQLLGGDIR